MIRAVKGAADRLTVFGCGWMALFLLITAPVDAANLKINKSDPKVKKESSTSSTDTSRMPDTAALKKTHGTDTALKSDTPASDTQPADTLIYSARMGGRFYHKRSFTHAPEPGAKGVLVGVDTVNLSETFTACPICFQSPITEEDYELEEAIANQVAGIVEFRYRKSEDEKIAARLNRVGQPMTKILDRRHLEFYFTPLRSSLEKNAISAGNGYVYFTTGLLDILEDDEEIAAVLAHEITHAEFRHVLQDFKLSQKLTLITAIASAIINKSANIGGVLQVLQDYAIHLVMNGFSRQFELEADAGAKWILESTGHDTNAMRRVLQKLDDLYPDAHDRSSLLQTHPEESDRIKAFDATWVFNKSLRGDTLSMRLKFQRPREVGWFKERNVPALYATLTNETDSPLIVFDVKADYMAIDLPQVKIEIDPKKMLIPEKSYAQIQILIIAKQELKRKPRSVDFSCAVSRLDDEPKRDPKTRKKSLEHISFHFDLAE